jgi:hypothetical protein
MEISPEEFLRLPDTEISALIRQQGRPQVGIFVPDGNRRMTLALSHEPPGSERFFQKYVELTTQFFQQNLEVFFSHGLENLIVPLISPSVLNREPRYQDLSLLQGLKIILQREDWLAFYQKHGIRIFSYGHLNHLAGHGLSVVCEWLDDLKQQTAGNQRHQLFLGFLAPTGFDAEQTRLVLNFFRKNNCAPNRDEQVSEIYGANIPAADFFIMSTKFAGLGALPPLLFNEKTQLYFLVAPGVFALTRDVFRRILFDYLFLRQPSARMQYPGDTQKDVPALADYYNSHQKTILGIGKRIGEFWVPVFDHAKGKE